MLPEWHKSLSAIGGRDDVQRFASRALARLGSGLEPLGRGFKVAMAPLPEEVRERLETEDIADTVAIDFAYPSAPGCRPVQRSHPLIAVLAETLLGRTLSVDNNGAMASDPSVLGRVGCWISEGVRARSTVVLLRLRHQLVSRTRRQETTLMVEEATALAWVAAGTAGPITGPEALSLLALAPADDPPRHVREREAARALALLQERAADLEGFADVRARALLDDHLRVREASNGDRAHLRPGAPASRRDRRVRAPAAGGLTLAPRRRSLGEARLAFDALSIEGGLLGAEWLGRVAQLQAAAQEPADYRIPKGLEIRDEIARGWRIAQACFQDMEAGRASGGNARALAERFIEDLLRDALGFASIARTGPSTIGDRVYPVRFFALGDRVPIVVAPAGAGLDAPLPKLGDERRRRTAFGLLQETLNASDAALWGLASDGLSLRIARDNASLTRPAWIEADLGRIFTEDLYPDFAALWLHRARIALRPRGRSGRDLPAGAVAGGGSAGGDASTGQAERWLSTGAQDTGAGVPLSRRELRSFVLRCTPAISRPIATSGSSCDWSIGSSFCSRSRNGTCCTHRTHPTRPASSMPMDTPSAAFALGRSAGAPTIAMAISGRWSRSSSGVLQVASRVSGCPPSPDCSRRRSARSLTRRRSRTVRSSVLCSIWPGFASLRDWFV